MFDSVAPKYDLMNDLMSGGLHRLWKQFTLSQTQLRPGQRALDVAEREVVEVHALAGLPAVEAVVEHEHVAGDRFELADEVRVHSLGVAARRLRLE